MLTHAGSQVLRTQRLLLRPYVQGDEVEMFRNWAADEAVTRYLTWEPHENIEFTRDLVAQWEASNVNDHYYHWGITLDGELVGDIAVVRWNEHNELAELGYCLSRRLWGQGLMTEALRAVMRLLFKEAGFHRIALNHDADNPASGRVMEKAGLKYEGRFRQAYKRRDGSFADLCHYGALKHEWLEEEGA